MKNGMVSLPTLVFPPFLKKALMLILIAALVVAGFFSVRGELPFMPILGVSMEPTLQSGNLILIEEVAPSEVKVGDIIVYKVPAAIQDHYGYPPIIAHRVIKINTERGINFRTKGDNSGEDPFTVRSQDLKGTISQQIPYAGLPLLFLQSEQGFIFVIVALSLFAIYLFADELGRSRRRATRGFFAPVVEESQHGIRALTQKIGNTEKRMGETQQALNNFASAIELYAEHLKSHTSAIQGLSEASHELKRGAAEQNKVLSRLVEIMGQAPPRVEPVSPRVELVTPEVEHVMPKVKKIQFPPGCVRSQQRPVDQKEVVKAG